MAKKQNNDSKAMDDDLSDIKPEGYIGDITPAQYWEWRCAIAEKNLAKQKLETARILHTLKSLQATKATLEAENFGLVQIPKANRELANYEKEFDDTRKKLEDALGESMKGAIINEAFQVIRPEVPSQGSA